MLRTDAASNSYDQARAARDEVLFSSRDRGVSNGGRIGRPRDEDWMKVEARELLVYNFSMSSRLPACVCSQGSLGPRSSSTSPSSLAALRQGLKLEASTIVTVTRFLPLYVRCN